MPLEDIAKKILDAGGVWSAMFLGAVAVAGYFFLALRASQSARIREGQECSKAKEASYEKRIEEMGRMTVALEKTAATLLSLISSSDARTLAFQEMVQGFAVLVETLKSERSSAKDSLDRIERRQENILSSVDRRGAP